MKVYTVVTAAKGHAPKTGESRNYRHCRDRAEFETRERAQDFADAWEIIHPEDDAWVEERRY